MLYDRTTFNFYFARLLYMAKEDKRQIIEPGDLFFFYRP